jgi:hypothetical protein
MACMSEERNLGQASQCTINAFDPNVAISPSQLTKHILRHAAHMDGFPDDPMTLIPGTADFLAGASPGRRQPPPRVGRHETRTPRTKRVHYEFAEKCRCCGEPDHRGLDCKASDAQTLKWQRYKITTMDNHYNLPKPRTAHLSVIVDDTIVPVDSVIDVEEDPLSEYIVSSPLSPVALRCFPRISSTSLSKCWAVDSACSINLSAHRADSITFNPSTEPLTVGGVGVTIKGRGRVRIKIHLQSSSVVTRDLFTLFTPALITRSSQGISILLNVRWMRKQWGCEFSFPPATDIGMLIVPTFTGVLRPPGTGLYTPLVLESSRSVEGRDTPPLALVSPADATLWHNRLGHLHMQSFEAKHENGVATVPHLGPGVRNISCDSCLLYKPTAARNKSPSVKLVSPSLQLFCNLWGPMNVPSPYGLRYSYLSWIITFISCW